MNHATKRGPGRRHKDGTYRGGRQHGKPAKMGFADAVQNAAAVKRAGAKARKLMHPLRDKHGAYTLVGAQDGRVVFENPFPARAERRVWLAGISAQRGF